MIPNLNWRGEPWLAPVSSEEVGDDAGDNKATDKQGEGDIEPSFPGFFEDIDERQVFVVLAESKKAAVDDGVDK